jgi:catechol 2,3-dioxygenase-like lactoylglutathione lyase family enzyme
MEGVRPARHGGGTPPLQMSGGGMKGINHLVLAARDLEAQRSLYAGLGFTLTPRADHPFGTSNSVVQLHGSYLELLSLTRPEIVPEPTAEKFSFAAYNRDFLARRAGFSMLALDSEDTAADLAAWKATGLKTYEPFEFSRMAKTARGEERRIGFSLGFVSDPAAPWLGLFSCRHFAPDYFAQTEYLHHANGAVRVEDVWISGEGAVGLAGYFETVVGGRASVKNGCSVLRTPIGSIVIAPPAMFEAEFGVLPPHLEDGPHLAGYTIGCRSLDFFDGKGLNHVGERLVIPPEEAFRTALAFRSI